MDDEDLATSIGGTLFVPKRSRTLSGKKHPPLPLQPAYRDKGVYASSLAIAPEMPFPVAHFWR